MKCQEIKTNGLYVITGLLIGLTMWFVFDRIEVGIEKRKAEKYFEQLENGFTDDHLDDHVYQIKNEMIRITDQEGIPVTIAPTSERVIFIYLWATWDISCVENLPDLHRFYEKTKDEIDLYLITAEQPSKVNRVLKNQRLDLPCYYFKQLGDVPLFLQQTDFPYACIIHNGKVQFEYSGIAPWDSEIFIHFIQNLQKEDNRISDLISIHRVDVLNVINFN